MSTDIIVINDTALATFIGDTAASRGINLSQHLAEQLELERAAPHGRCSLCNLALSGDEFMRPGGMHDNCAGDHYGE